MTTTLTTPCLDHWINGRREAGPARGTVPVSESASGETVVEVPLATPEVVDRAVRGAAEAQLEWRRTSLSARTKVLFAAHELIQRHRREFAELVTREHGKVLADAEAEVQRGLEQVEFACGIGQLLKGEMSAQVSRGVDTYTLRQPVGVVAGITPFNFPFMVPLWMAPLAIACGNSFVLKPSEQVPSAALLLAELFGEAGLPSGVFNVVHGDKEAVDALLTHSSVDAVSFVGSTPVARHVQATAIAHGKRVQALGGAKNHGVVLPDADLDLAADALVSAAYGAAGQRCMAISVAVAVGDVADALCEKLEARIRRLTLGDGMEADVDLGPVVSERHLSRVRELIGTGAGQGATLRIDGRDAVDGETGGHFVGATLFDRVEPGMAIYDEEIFGPVLCVVRRDSFESALQLIADCPYGNGAAVFTNDGGLARRFEDEVTAGMVGVNVSIPVPVSYYSFGGWKQSIFADVHAHGPEAVRFYTRGKVVTRRWPDQRHAGVNLGFPTAT